MTNDSPGTHTAFTRSASAFLVLAVILGSLFPTKSQASSGPPRLASMPRADLQLAKKGYGVHRRVPARVYGNSVIPGGVRGSSELVSALERDQIVKAHYANFDAANAYVVHVEHAKLVYVSYRMGNEIYWTKNKVRLAKGEALLTDGKSTIRARCGNRIADMSQSRVSSREPAPALLDTALDLPQEAALRLASNSPGSMGQGVAANSGSDGGATLEAPIAPVQAAFLYGSPHSTTPEVPRTTIAPARAATELAPRPLDEAPLLPALAKAIDDEVFAVLLPTPHTQLTPSGPSLPFGDILQTLVPLGTPTVQAPAIGLVTATGTVLAAFPAILSDVAMPSEVLLTHDATELPEPSSFALLLLALSLVALFGQAVTVNSFGSAVSSEQG